MSFRDFDSIPTNPVVSSQLKAVGYDAERRTLCIDFPKKEGFSRYHYTDVPPSVFDELNKAESIGKFFGANIKGKFEFQKLAQAVHE